MTELTKVLMTIQHQLKAPKGQRNDFGKYNYRSCEDILEAVKPLNAANNLLLTLSDEPVFIGDWHYIKATATITNGTDTHSVTAYARESLTKKGMDDSQITGTASSYARKYALNGLYLIDDTKDADSNEYQKNQQQPQRQQQAPSNPAPPSNPNAISPAQIKALGTKVNIVAKASGGDAKATYEAAAGVFGITKGTKDLTKAEASKIIDYLATLEGAN